MSISTPFIRRPVATTLLTFGIAMAGGKPQTCVPNPAGRCVRPYHDTADVNGGGPHGEVNAVADVDSGRMDA